MPLGRRSPAQRPRLLEVRPLVPDDLRVLATARKPVAVVKTLRERHHRIARLDAAGLPMHEILELTGISFQRLYTLRRDPAYQELRSLYKGQVNEEHLRAIDDHAIRSINNLKRMEAMVEEYIDEAEETGEKIPLKTLIPLIADRADRFGYGKRSTQTHAHINLGTEIEEARARYMGQTIDGTASRVPSRTPVAVSSPAQPQGSRPAVDRRGL